MFLASHLLSALRRTLPLLATSATLVHGQTLGDDRIADASLTEVPFTSSRWIYTGAEPKPVTVGRDTAWSISGVAYLSDVSLEDGIIELEALRGFPALVFHADSPEEYETVYLRTPYTDRSDAIQYSPVYRRFLPWRLHPDGQARASFDTTGGMFARNRFRIAVLGRSVRVYVNGARTPSLVTTLRHPSRGGRIGVWGMAIAEGMQRFVRFSYLALPSAGSPVASPVPAALRQWELATLPLSATHTQYPRASPSLTWRAVDADHDGLVDLTRYLGALQTEGRAVPAAARTILHRDRATTARLALAFCDRVAVFLNGRRVFAGRLPLVVGDDNPRIAMRDTLPLALPAGKSEIMIVSTGQTFMFGDGNGGWGFSAHLLPAAGHASAGARIR